MSAEQPKLKQKKEEKCPNCFQLKSKLQSFFVLLFFPEYLRAMELI